MTVPYFAALEIGAVGTAAVVLGFAAAGMVGAGRGGLRELVAERRGVLAAVGVGVGWDLWMKSGGESGGGGELPSGNCSGNCSGAEVLC